jgi:sphingolipid delta-4 desaturase
VEEPEPHRVRALEVLRRHPEVRELFGRNPYTALICIGLVVLQVAAAHALQPAPWWLVILAAWGFGAFVAHATLVAYHECAHQLVFRHRLANRLLGIATNLPTLFPSYASFERYHLKHHQYQGDYGADIDVPSAWEAGLAGRHLLGKAAWQLFFPILHSLRSGRLQPRVPLVTPWVIVNAVVQVAFDVWLLTWLAPSGTLYLVLSFFFCVGLHPLGARWIQEHFVLAPGQETYSYYGPLNRVALNIGYHNEHHDFPFIPWHRLPRLTALAPEVYASLHSHRSWVRLWIRFLTDSRLSVFQRAVRSPEANAQRAALPRGLYAPGTFDETTAGAA